MAASQPVVFLAFANDASRKLNLGREKDNIRKTLRDVEARQLIDVWDIADASLARLAEEIGVYGDRLALFHYGGHAGRQGLELREGDGNAMAFAEGLAALLAATPVRLVFLNGCGTRPQVKALHAAGIKAVLATAVPIEDETATEFAEQFYAALARGDSIGKAFERANAFLLARRGSPATIISRGDAIADDEAAADDTPETTPWGLYLADDDQSLLGWTPCPPAVMQLGAGKIDASANSNGILRTRLAAELKGLGDNAIKQAISTAENDPDAALVEAIINAFPLPIGEQLRLLFVRKQPDVARLRQILRTYEVAMQLVGYAALAQLWDAMEAAGDDFVLAPEHRTALNSFMALVSQTVGDHDYYGLTIEVLQILQENRLTPFMEQSAKVQADLTDVASTAAHAALEQLRRQPLPADGDAGLPALCRDATAHLAELLCDLAFIALYKATTIRSIAVTRNRQGKPPLFLHQAIALDGALLRSEVEQLPYRTGFTDNAAVVLQRKRDEFSDFLNLTPLVFDESAFSGGRVPNLFFFSHFDFASDADDPALVFVQISNPATRLTIPDPNGRFEYLRPVRRLFQAFRAKVFGQ